MEPSKAKDLYNSLLVFSFMAELRIEIPEDLKQRISELPDVDWTLFIKKAIELKAFELELKRSRKLRQLLFKSIIAKSKLIEEDALEIGREINESMYEDLKNSGFL